MSNDTETTLASGAKVAKGASKGKTAAKGNKAAAKGAARGKATKAAKPASKRASTSTRKAGQPLGYRVPTEGKIKLVAKENPYRAETKAFDTFALIAKAGTVEKTRELAAKAPDKYDLGYLRYAARDGFIAFS